MKPTLSMKNQINQLMKNPDPKSLWVLILSNQEALFAKPDDTQAFAELGEKSIVVSSKRGRSHGKEGTSRDDDFAFKYFEKTQWSLVVVSDGAGSAYLARAGSKIACDAVVEYFEINNDSEQEIKLEILIDEYNHNKTVEKLRNQEAF